MRVRNVATLLLAALVLCAGMGLSVHAATESEKKAGALAALRQGNNLLDAGDPAGALTKYRHAMELYPSPKLHFNVGEALMKLSRSAEAYESFSMFLEWAPDASPATRAEAERYLVELEGKISFLSVEVEPKSASAKVDGEVRGRSPIPLAPGTHRLRVDGAEGFVPFEEDVNLAVGARVKRSVKLTRPAPEPAAVATHSSGAPDRHGAGAVVPTPADRGGTIGESGGLPPGDESWRTRRVVGYAIGVAGVAVAGGGVVLTLTGRSRADSARARAEDAAANGDAAAWDLARSDVDAAKKRNTLGWVLAGVGTATVVGGVLLLVKNPSPSDAAHLSMLTPWADRQGGGMVAGWVW